jgi:hypothetical protein
MRRRTQAARTLGGRASSRAADGFSTLDVLKRSTKAELGFENRRSRGRDPSLTRVAGPFLGEMEST